MQIPVTPHHLDDFPNQPAQTVEEILGKIDASLDVALNLCKTPLVEERS